MQKLVVIVPGYYGSKLVEAATDRLVWLDLGSLLQPDATLRELRLDLGHPDRIVARGILDELVLLPFLAPDIYKTLQDFLRDNLGYPKDHVRSFYYDWRKSLTEAAEDLHRQIQRWLCETGLSQVDLIAHSYGGLVARSYLRRHGAAAVDWLITLGTPHRGMLKTFEALTDGIALATFGRAQSRTTSRTFPSAYELVPHAAADGYFTWNGQPASALTESGWVSTPAMDQHLAAARNVITTELPDQLPVKACLIYGTRLDTTTSADGAPGRKLRFGHSDLGDSTVPLASAAGRGLASQQALHRFPIPLGSHMTLFNDPVARDLMTDILRRNSVPSRHVVMRFASGNFFQPLSQNRLVVEARDDAGAPLPGITVTLRITTPVKRTVTVPQRAEGDFVTPVKMPGAGTPFRCTVEAAGAALPSPVVETFLLLPRG